MACTTFLPIVDQSRIITLSVETTGPLLNSSICQCGTRNCKSRRCRRRRHRK